MTKLEYLNNGSDRDKVYTWKKLGSNKIEEGTAVYSLDMIYLVNVPNSSLNNYLLYCKKEYLSYQNGAIDWLSGELFDSDYWEITFGNNIVSPYFSVLLTASQYQEVLDEYEEQGFPGLESFIPYETLNNTGSVVISDEDYRRCLSCLGYPFVQEEELEYTREEITELAIKPALEEYFHWLPPLMVTTEDVQTDGQEIDMPSEAYNCVGLSLQQFGGSVNGNILSPLFYGMEQSLYGGFNYTNLSGSYYGSAAPKTASNTLSSILGNRASAQAIINYTRRVHYEGPYKRSDNSQYVRVYSNTMGTFNVWWAKKSLDFNDVRYEDRRYVFDYIEANVKELFGYLRRQAQSEVPGRIDYGKWIEEAKDKKSSIQEIYRKIVKGSGIMRGSLG